MNPLSAGPQGVLGLIGEVSVSRLWPVGVTVPESSSAFILDPLKRKSLYMVSCIKFNWTLRHFFYIFQVFCYYLLTVKSLQIHMVLFIQWNTNEEYHLFLVIMPVKPY